MPDQIKLPGLGDVQKKYVIGGVVVGGLVAVVVFIRARNKAATTASANTSGAAGSSLVTDPAGNQCTSLDPNSGYCPGSPEDVAYQESASGSYSNLGASDYGGYGYGGASGAGLTVTDPAGNVCAAVNPATGYCPGTSQDLAAQGTTPATTVPASPSTSEPTTNSAWLTDALGVLPGGSSSANEAALAGVLGGLTVTTAQKNIFLEAAGIIGRPPQGYPQPIKTSDTAAQPGSPGKTAGAISGLTVVPSGTGIQAKWASAANATGGYAWQLTGPESKSGNTKSNLVTVHGLKKGTYNFGIQALPGGQGDNKSVTVG
jgi:hypothetical protein